MFSLLIINPYDCITILGQIIIPYGDDFFYLLILIIQQLKVVKRNIENLQA